MTLPSIDTTATILHAAAEEFGTITVKVTDLRFWDHLRDDPNPAAAAWTEDDRTLWIDTRAGTDLDKAMGLLADVVAKAAAARIALYLPTTGEGGDRG